MQQVSVALKGEKGDRPKAIVQMNSRDRKIWLGHTRSFTFENQGSLGITDSVFYVGW
jgi:hypothetical protein